MKTHETTARPPLTFRSAQAAVIANKLAKGLSIGDIGLEFGLLTEEVAEAHHAWRKHRAPRPGWLRRIAARLRIRPLPPLLTNPDPVRLEVADAIIFLLGISDMLGFDAGQAVADKLAINAGRAYTALPNGTHVRDSRHG